MNGESLVQTDARRLLSRVNIDEQGCWLWKGGKNRGGYGRFRFRGRMEGAHRVSFLIHVGPIPDGLHVLHKCDIPACVNPDHLFLGTAKDNSDDKFSKHRERFLAGEQNPMAKLTEDDVISIRNSCGVSVSDLARRYNVSRRLIRMIIQGVTWKHVATS